MEIAGNVDKLQIPVLGESTRVQRWYVLPFALALAAACTFALPGTVTADDAGGPTPRLCSDVFDGHLGETTQLKGVRNPYATFDRFALTSTQCSPNEVVEIFLSQGWQVEPNRGPIVPAGELDVQVLRFTYTPPIWGNLLRKLVGGFGPIDETSVFMLGSRVLSVQNQAIK